MVCGEMTLSDHVGDLDTCDSCGGGMEGFEAHHCAGDPLDESVVLFQDVVEVFDLPDRDDAPSSGEL